MLHNDFYTPDKQGPYETASVGRLELEEGGVIEDCWLAYATAGELNADRSNAILIPTWYSGTHSAWFENYIGEDHALDPSRYFIICVNQIGNGLSVSPANTDDPSIAMSKFPHVRIGDDVIAQERLLREKFGIEELFAVVGGSMGAQQTYEWIVRFPDKVRRAAPVAGTARNTPHDFLFTRTLNEAILSDPGYNGGEYTSHTDVADGLRRQSHLWAVMGLSTEWWKQEAWRGLGLDSVDAVIDDFLDPLFASMDPGTLLNNAWKWQRGDVSRHTGGDLAAALGRVTAKTFVMPISEDMFFPVRDCAEEQKLIPGSELRVIDDIAGHLGLFNLSPGYIPQIDANLRELFDAEV
ncbi:MULTISPECIES: alpha/beta fold hydrolase [Corynebacterium]|jgi:homoserine O-acetyltransferase|uniref:alpha/beta fold hydrolase n=1 Tax=Corynebacterium TaxID=1716 RepID=UPI00102F8FBE|nr:alpha/beta fold hydrolase [Corynebacterium neomassiliense]MCI1256994.1 alpha/beta fold hydrolase [Corynebacterium provencense]